MLRGLLVVALLVLPTVGAAVWSMLQAPTYAAQIDLLHRPVDGTPSDAVDRQLATHRVLLLRRDDLDEVARAVGRDAEGFADDVSVEVVEGSSILRIEVVDENRRRAEQAAQRLADQYTGTAGRLASSSGIGEVRVVDPPTALPDPVGPQPLRAAAAGALTGAVLVAAFLAFLRLRNEPGGRSDR